MLNWTALAIAATAALLFLCGVLFDRCDTREKDCRQATYTACAAAGGHECTLTASRTCGGSSLR